MSRDPLLQPFKLKHLTLRNRVLLTAHEPAYAENGMPKERYRAYHVERAGAGIALTMTAGSASVARDSAPAFNNILAWKDEVVGWMRKLVDECHEHGAAVMIQLTHLGRRTRWDAGDWLPVVSASEQREPAHRAVPKRLEDWDIERITKDYGDAAERMKAAGLDGIEIMANGHLLDQLWSPRTNDLDAPYGVSLDDSMRFTFDVLTEVRRRVGPEFIVGVRYVGDETVPDGLSKANGLEISRRLKSSGMVDFLNVVRGHIDTDAGLTDMIPIQGMPSAPHLDFAGEIRSATDFPTFHAGRIPDVATARHAIASGKLDMVGMTRAHLADPEILAKVIAGEEERIRPCVGANYCIDRASKGQEALCIHNPATGRETLGLNTIDHAGKPRRVVIVGAGPAGMEAARVAALRGHDVIVHEAASDPGGQVRLTARTERRREMLSIISWRFDECVRAGVTFHFNSLADAEVVLGEGADDIIIATGGLPNDEVLTTGNELVVSSWDILSGDVAPGANVLIEDGAGDAAGLQAAEAVVSEGGQVEITTRDRTVSPEVMGMSLTPAMRKLQPAGAIFTVGWRVSAVTQEGNELVAELSSDYGDFKATRRVDQVVVNHGTLPLDELYFDLKPLSANLGAVDYDALVEGRPQAVERNPEGRFRLFRIGDAVASRDTHAAIYDGLRLARCI